MKISAGTRCAIDKPQIPAKSQRVRHNRGGKSTEYQKI